MSQSRQKDDCASYCVAQFSDALRRRLTAEGYLLTSVVASRSPRGDVSQLKTALGQNVDFVVLMYASPHLGRLVAAAGYPYVVSYSSAVSRPNAWHVGYDLAGVLETFAGHGRKTGVRSVTVVLFGDGVGASVETVLKDSGIRVRQMTITPLVGYGRHEGIERACFLPLVEDNGRKIVYNTCETGVLSPRDVNFRKVIKTMKHIGCALLLLLVGCASIKSTEDIPCEKGFNSALFSGEWYEIARLPNVLETELNDVTVSYKMLGPQSVEMVRTGFCEDRERVLTARGKLEGDGKIGLFRMRFRYDFATLHRVLWFSPKYEQAIVAGDDLTSLWILARTKQLPKDDLDKLVKMAEGWGFDTKQLEYPQEAKK